ncbi:MAG: anthranilate phosphoribosyltransferase [Planctomycetota bacterium]|nr:anthranilate phosphoribosyltransferase [Planctomycetota bacterium]
MFATYLGQVSAGESLDFEGMRGAVDLIMQGAVPDGQIGLFLTALREKGETVPEIAGAAAALRQHMTPIRTSRTDLVDTCGTGGGGSKKFNISTAAAIVAAAAGCAVAKHGNRSITSKTGSADVLSELGVNIMASAPTVERCLDELGICFCFAPLLHPAMKRVADIRRQLGVPTIFNLLGPLANPANAPYHLLGVSKPHLRNTLAEALGLLKTKRAVVMYGDDGLDEITLAGATQGTLTEDGKQSEFAWTPADFGLHVQSLESLIVDGPAQSAAIIRRILDGEKGTARDIVVANAAGAIWTAQKVDTVKHGAELAAEAIDSGEAKRVLARLGELTNRSA